MSYLLSFDPKKPLSVKPDDFEGTPTETNLFEALWLIVAGAPASGADVEHAITLKQALKASSVEGGSIKLVVCPTCRQRWMQHSKSIRTLDKPVDIILEAEEFEYMRNSPRKWATVPGELEEYFGELLRRFSEMKAKPADQWKKFIAERSLE